MITILSFRTSAIFNAKQAALKTVDTKAVAQGEDISDLDEDEVDASYGREKVDLTVEQTSAVDGDDALDEMDDFDLLDATIDPHDINSLMKRAKLETEIEFEQTFIKAKMVYRLAMSEANPMKVDE